MKSLSLSILGLILYSSLFSQGYRDFIITFSGDSIVCEITLINDQNIFYNHRPKKAQVNDHMAIENVSSYSSQGQNIDLTLAQYEEIELPEYDGVQWQYCELVGTSVLGGLTKVTIHVDCGDKESAWEDTRLRNKDGSVRKFQTMIEAINYYGALGWEVMEASPISHGNRLVYHYLIKRKVE
jgi:hypothetical protein